MKKKRVYSMILAMLMAGLSCANALAATHTVASGDTLSKIAQEYGVTLEEVLAANPQIKNANLIYPGDVVTLPDGTQVAASSSAGTQTSTTRPATSGETKIGKISGVRAKEIPGYTAVKIPTDTISYDADMVMNYIQEFANLTQVPHASYKTGKMTQYLKDWAAAHGIQCETEEIGNVIMSLPATPGYEDAPTIAFGGHIDMVEAVDPGVTHDWENDPLDLLWTPNSVKADGTSLGADNGSGLAFMLTYMAYADEFVHGPVRCIFTVDEEVGLLGAAALDPKYVADVDYLINVDGGYGGATISCAGGKYFDFTHTADWEQVSGMVAYELEFSGLQGGHSAGVGGGKANGLVAMANAILSIAQEGVEVRIASMEGGSASNAIPTSSKAVIVLNSADVATADAVMQEFAKLFDESYSAIETDYTFRYGKSSASVSKALTAELSEDLVQLMSAVPNNIHTLLATASGTEASSNLGTFSLTDETVTFRCMMRSSSTYQSEQITIINNALAEMSGFTVDVPTTFATWPLKGSNKLGDIAAEVFQEMTGEDFPLQAIHAGVECGEFAEKNEDMYIISTGISGGSDGHTTAETMNFDMVEVGMDFLVALAERLAQE